MEIAFLGAAGTVTGSKYLVSTAVERVLIDCGMFQGAKALRERNWAGLPFDAATVQAVVVTHAHLDHTGLLPLLVKSGFRGRIHATPGTTALCRVLLADAAHLQEQDAEFANRHGYSKHHPALPLFTRDDVERTLPLFTEHDFDSTFLVGDLRLVLEPVGHILGAASVRLEGEDRSVVFSGDVGRPNDVIMKPPRPYRGSDVLVVESTYGNRRHPDEDPAARLADVVNRVCGRGGVLLVPAFAVGRSQAILHVLADLKAAGRIPDVPAYLDSPMAIDATHIFCHHPHEHRLPPDACRAMCEFATYTRDVEASKAIGRRKGPMIVIAGSGMATGGRILHHLERFGGDARNGVLLAGFQAAGTRGASLRDGAETLRLHGKDITIRAERFVIDGLSGHADRVELLDWMRGAERAPGRVFVTHGEPAGAEGLRSAMQAELGWSAHVAIDGERVTL